ncbi:unnamed protein product, partial [Oppiella nova]
MHFPLLKCWKWIVLWISPILLSSLFLYSNEKEIKCVFVVSLMIIYWLTEAVPLAVTALLPMFLYPFLEIMSTKEISGKYINETLMVFLDTATTALMVPIIEAVILNIMEQKRTSVSVTTISHHNTNDLNNNGNLDPKEVEIVDSRRKNSFKVRMERDANKEEKSFKLMRRVLFLSVTFSSLIGGTGTLTGTTTNLIFKGFASRFFRDPDFFRGWAPALHPQSTNYINDASAAMLIVCLMFVIPANPRDLQNSKPLMTWKAVHEKTPWGVFILMGGAFAMSSGIK